jgi:hypothetical protein
LKYAVEGRAVVYFVVEVAADDEREARELAEEQVVDRLNGGAALCAWEAIDLEFDRVEDVGDEDDVTPAGRTAPAGG